MKNLLIPTLKKTYIFTVKRERNTLKYLIGFTQQAAIINKSCDDIILINSLAVIPLAYIIF